MISITTRTASEYMVVLDEKPESDLERYSRRNAVRATLDGGGVPSDSGYSDTDREIEIKADITEAEKEVLKHMIQNYVLFNVATKDGFYICMINKFRANGGEAYIKLLITK